MKRHVLYIILFICILLLAGCGGQPDRPDQMTEHIVSEESDGLRLDTDEVVRLYQEIYDEVTGADAVNVEQSPERIQCIVQKLGEKGYAAVDSENQTDMTEKEQVLSFCGSVDKKEEAELAIISVEALYKFTIYNLSTANGKVKVSRELYQYINESFEMVSTASYAADSWQYTKEGYLIFTGSSYSEESYVLTMSDVPETAAFRVEPLDEQCREYNRRYILPMGYRKNNMFLCDWSEEDYGELDFYDVFDRFYPSLYQQPVPYVEDVNINVGAVYQIQEEEFENVVMMHLAIDMETLQAKTKYLPEEKAYEYRPRGFHEVEYPNIPYPEVAGYATNDDGTITLTVNAVYPSEGTSKAYTHEVVIRPLDDDGFQYVSNTVIPSKDDYGTGWHTDRLSDAAWEEIYGGLPQPYAEYVKVLEQIMSEHTDPNGREYDAGGSGQESFANNLFAILDVDGDGRQELIFNFNESYMAAMCEVVYAYDEESGILREEFLEWADNTYYSNGFVKVFFSHNQGRDPESRGTWPYALYQYDEETDSYQVRYYVESWDKHAYNDAHSDEFPDELDTDGDGILYYITEGRQSVDDADVVPVNQEEYDNWVQETIPEWCEINVAYHAMTEQEIEGIRDAYEQILKYAQQSERWLSGGQQYQLLGNYLLYDLDHDGKLELVRNVVQGSGRFSDNYFYSLTDEGEVAELPLVKLWGGAKASVMEDFDIASWYYTEAYRDIFGVTYYEGKDFERDGAYGGYEATGFYYLDDGVVFQDIIRNCSRFTDRETGEADNNYYIRTITNAESVKIEITEEEYDIIRDDYVKDMETVEVYQNWVYYTADELSDDQQIRLRLLESYLGSL